MTLPKALFNPRLYTRIQDLWFAGLPADATVASAELQQRWFPRDPAVRDAFDSECRTHLEAALEAIRPGTAPVEDLQRDLAAEVQVRPCPPAVKCDMATLTRRPWQSCADEHTRARTALSLVLLLDQIPRNLYRTPATLPLVYTHYDVLSRSLASTLLSANPRPDAHESLRAAPVRRVWFAMPLVHSEDRALHGRVAGFVDECAADMREGDGEAVAFLENMRRAGLKHKEVVDRFGRYPYRNKFLGRQSTAEEEAWIKEGGDTFGVAG
jgi:uncharacterized protein (DUF924 family)